MTSSILTQTATVPMAVAWRDGKLWLLDQTRLPFVEHVFNCDTLESVFGAIQALKVRGAPAIGIAAAYGMLVDLDPEGDLPVLLRQRADYLISARPTAVNLAWAVQRMLSVMTAAVHDGLCGNVLKIRLEKEAIAIHEEDRTACRAIGEAGASLVAKFPKVLTHCNAGSLAVSELGTALAPIYVAAARGVPVHVYVDETRPLLQGARLTAFELGRAGVNRTLITDSMAAHVMAQGEVQMVLVGTDRVAANGDVANKIGTLGLAILCQYFGIPFYVACPVSTIDLETLTGAHIHIEQRLGDEVRQVAGIDLAEADTPVFNPAFDVTPAALVTGIITDGGIVTAPFGPALAAIVAASVRDRVVSQSAELNSGA
ncbi:MAG: methylthioribose-1-phosphate isomerase [Candidatus Pseudothioglobus sp.]|jgi:methylthioribose-1-phosphate isomerase